MRRFLTVFSLASILVLTAGRPAVGQSEAPAQAPAAESGRHVPSPTEVIMPHITDSKEIELPCFKNWAEWQCAFHLPVWNVTIGGRTIDMGPTKHVVFLAFAGFLCVLMMFFVARAHESASKSAGHPKGFAASLEAIMLYLRNTVYVPVLGGHGGQAFVPFTMTLFFFIAFCNYMGLFPWASTPTGNISVTATLALITFMVTEIAGMRALGAGYIKTIIYVPPHDMPLIMKPIMMVIMSVIELVSKFTKPFALTVRLFANMLAGHVIILALISLIFAFGVAAYPGILMALFIMGLEIIVAGVQAFLFSLLAAVFIGQVRAAHH
ncbi:MAG TPA: F0F1 ATP synthase subunit A [Gemmatimonadaceae bacterium]